MAEENPEKKTDRRIIPKSTQRDKARAAIEAILSTGKQQIDAQKSIIKPFAIEKNSVNAIPIKTIEPAKSDKIPELDLYQKILADQRKQVTASRQGPGQKLEIDKQTARQVPVEHIWHQKPAKDRKPLRSSGNSIIKEIVAKDIAKMYQKARLAKQQKIS